MFPTKPSKAITPLPVPKKPRFELPEFQHYIPMGPVCNLQDKSTQKNIFLDLQDRSTQTSKFLSRSEVTRDNTNIIIHDMDAENTAQYTFKREINAETNTSKLLRLIARKQNTLITELQFVIGLLFILVILLFVIIITLRIQL